jgi:hypothetical protein
MLAGPPGKRRQSEPRAPRWAPGVVVTWVIIGILLSPDLVSAQTPVSNDRKNVGAYRGPFQHRGVINITAGSNPTLDDSNSLATRPGVVMSADAGYKVVLTRFGSNSPTSELVLTPLVGMDIGWSRSLGVIESGRLALRMGWSDAWFHFGVGPGARLVHTSTGIVWSPIVSIQSNWLMGSVVFEIEIPTKEGHSTGTRLLVGTDLFRWLRPW